MTGLRRGSLLLRASLILALCVANLVAVSTSSALAATTHYVSTAFLGLPFNTSCSEPGYGSIQAAVNASASGDTIVVCDGVYQESLAIDRSVSLLGSGNSVVTPPAGFTGGDLVTVIGRTTSAVMSGFVVSGPGRGGCASIQAGVRVTGGARLDLSSTVIRDIRDIREGTGALSGCQNGEGIRVGHRGDGSGPGSLRLDGVIIVDFQKNGITVNGEGSNANIMNTTVRGAGPTTALAQNGIQVSRGASATISTSTIRDVDYAPHPVVACGLLIFDANGVNDDTNIFLNNEKDKCTFGGRGGTTEGLP
jgi:hypothetical protein